MRLYEFCQAIKLFLALVFRKAVPWEKRRITPLQAWQVAKIVWLEEGLKNE